jgi:2-dehydropantoate 2-reductase
MGQVPQTIYGIIGDGRVATHFKHYFTLLDLPVRTWSRRAAKSDPRQLPEQLQYCDTILVLIQDAAIVPFIQEHPFLKTRTLVHFSGSLTTPLAFGVHPLMSFGPSLYDLVTYRRIPFVCDFGFRFQEVFPGLENPVFEIKPELKPLYHSLCVMSGNFTVLLWQKMFAELETTFDIPREAAVPYLSRIASNLIEDSRGALTGPLQRRDSETIERNLEALESDPFHRVYRSFVDAYRETTGGHA